MNILKKIVNIDLVISCVCLALLVFITFSNVILRYCFNAPYQWGEEVQMLLIVWVIWYGGSAAFRTGNQICVDMILGLLPKAVQKAANIVIFVLSFLVIAFMFRQGLSYILQLYSTNRVTETLHIPRAFVYSCMPVGCLLMLFNMTGQFIKEWRGGSSDD